MQLTRQRMRACKARVLERGQDIASRVQGCRVTFVCLLQELKVPMQPEYIFPLGSNAK